MEYERFDIARTLAGDSVILRNGTKAYIRHKEEEEFFISESESKDLLTRLDSDSQVTRLQDNLSEEEFLIFIES